MDSKTFFDIYLQTEKTSTILNAQYVLVSSRIRLKDRYNIDNAITAINTLYPNNSVLYKGTIDDMREEYYDQLERNLPLLASIAVIAFKDNKTVIFLCTKNEMKLEYMKWLVSFYKFRLKIKVYDYRMIVYNIEDFEDVPRSVIKKCEKIISEKKKYNRKYLFQTESGRKELHVQLKDMSVSDLKKEVKSRGLYLSGMDKDDMIEILEIFL